MSWFRSKRKVATEAATQALRPLMALVGMSGGMSNWMWHDPYLLGFMNFTASFYAKAETNGKVGPEDLGNAIFEAFTNVSNMDGKAIAMRAVGFAEGRDPEFEQGMHDAMTTALYSVGMLDVNDPEPLVQSSAALGRAMLTMPMAGDERGSISGAMMQNSFIRRVKELRKEENA